MEKFKCRKWENLNVRKRKTKSKKRKYLYVEKGKI